MRMRPLHWFALAALLLGGGAVAWFLSIDAGAPPPLLAIDAVRRAPVEAPAPLEGSVADDPLGGIYSGVVVDERGEPIPGADVLLVRFNSGEDIDFSALSGDPRDFDPAKIPTLGDFHVSNRQKTDALGRFTIQAAGAKDRVQMVVAWKRLYAPAFAATGKPTDEVRVVLKPGGHLKGTVVDPSGNPVAGAVVEIYLQQRAGVTPIPEEGSAGTSFKREKRPLARAPLLGDLLGRVIGPEVYGLDKRTTEALTTSTGTDGTFTFGPVDDEVQVWVVVNHPAYKWTNHDKLPDGRTQVPVLVPGKVLERRYVLEDGGFIEGRVVSDANHTQGVEGVLIKLDHIVGYMMHPWYKIRSRTATTREDGSFRMSGLDAGPYTAMLYHASFGSQAVVGIPERAKNLLWIVKSKGALRGTVHGLEGNRPPGGRVEVFFETVASQGGSRRTPARQLAVLSKEGVFEIPQLEPGEYRVNVRAGTFASRHEPVTITPHVVFEQTFEAGGGAELAVSLADTQGRAVDPASLTLIRVDPGGRETPLGTYTTRGGRVAETGLLPGTYRLEAWAAGFLPQKSEAFTLSRERPTTVGPLVLRKPGWLRILSVTEERERPPKEAHLEVREGLGEFRPLYLRTGQDLSVAPGPLTVRGSGLDGLAFEETFEVREGEVLQVRVVLRPK